MLAGTLESMGYVVSYEYEDHYFVDGVDSGVVGKDPAPGGNVQIRSTPKRVVTKRSGFGAAKGGGGGGKSDYENPYDRLHNTYQKINDLLRERENLERRYQRLVDRNLATAEKMAEISKRNIQNQKEEYIRRVEENQ